MSELARIFPDSGRPVRFAIVDGLVWPALVDVCRELGKANPSNVAAGLPKGCLHTAEVIDDLGRARPTMVVHPHRGLPRVILQSRSKAKERLESWIFDDMIPSVLETGSYSLRPPEPVWGELELARRHVVALEQLQEVRAELAVALPKVEAWDAVARDGSWLDSGAVAKELCIPGISSAQKLHQRLDQVFIFHRPCDGNRHPTVVEGRKCSGHWEPYAPYVTKRLLAIKWDKPSWGQRARRAGWEYPHVVFSPDGVDAVRKYLTKGNTLKATG